MKPRTRLIIIISAIILTAVIVVLTLLNTKQTALLTVSSTDAQAIITVSAITGGKDVTPPNGVQGRFSQKVPVGDYVVVAKSATSSAKRTVTVKAGPEVKVNLTFAAPLPLEMVAGVPAANFIDDGHVLQFVNLETNNLTRINSQNQVTGLGNYSLHNVRWADPSFGAGVASDGRFNLLKNLSPSLLDVPFTVSSNSSLAVAPNQDIYLSSGSAVYLYSGGNFTKIYQTNDTISVMAASNEAVIGIIGAKAKSGQKADEGKVIRITRSGQTKSIDGEVYDSYWSPDGSKVIINGDEGTSVLDKDLGKVIQLPQSNVNSPVWLDNDTIAFGIGSDLWRFDVSSGLSQLIATSPNLTFVQNYLSKDGNYLYVTTQNYKDGKNQSIQRIGLKGQKPTTVASILGIILPNTLGQCHLSYVNYTAPTVSVRGPQASAAACTASAQKYLQTYHVDTKAIGLSFSAL